MPGNERALLFSCLALLLFTAVEAGPVGQVASMLWLASIAALTLINAGAAVGVLTAALAVHSARHFGGWGSPFQRPDNYALVLVMLLIALARLRPQAKQLTDALPALILGLLVYSLGHTVVMGVASRANFAWLMRMFVIPLAVFLIVMNATLRGREVEALRTVLVALGLYMAVVSIFERLEWNALIFPTWIARPGFSRFVGRSGALLAQPAWNGLALSLTGCFLLLPTAGRKETRKVFAAAGGSLILIAIFTTYTRAVWLATLIGVPMFLFRTGPRAVTTSGLRRVAVAFATLLVMIGMVAFPGERTSDRIGNVDTIQFRLALWTTGLRMAADRPLFGYGFGEYGEYASMYQNAADPLEFAPDVNIGQNAAAHNTLVSILVELGLVGLLLYAGCVILIVTRARKAARGLWGHPGVAWVDTFVWLYIFQTQFIVAHVPTVNLIFFGTLGAIAGTSRRRLTPVAGAPGPSVTLRQAI